MAWCKRTATDYKDCIDQIRQFTQKEFAAGAVTAGGGNTGDGEIFGQSSSEHSVAETWTLACTTLGGNDVAIFSVVGSVSGAQADATAGVPYSIDEVSFTIVAGAVDFAVSDSFTFDIAVSTAEWIQDRWWTDYEGGVGPGTGTQYGLIQHGIGGGSDEIYASLISTTDDASYWNVVIGGLTGFSENIPSFGGQPGWNAQYVCANNTSFIFYVAFTSRSITIFLIPVEGSHELGHVGWLNSYASPSQWSYPMVVGGSAPASTTTIGTTGRRNCYAGDNLTVLDGTTARDITKVSPKSYGYFSTWQSSPDGFMRIYPAAPIYEGGDTIFGELDGIFWITPYVPGGGLLTALALIRGSLADYGGSPREVCGISLRNVTNTAAGEIAVFDLIGD